jgi:dihydroceramide fatty acyl 2-hydroxylase
VGGPAGGPHQQDGLPGRHEALGAVGPEGGAGLLEVERAEEVLAEVAVLAGGRFWLAWHGAAYCQRRDAFVRLISAKRKVFETELSHLPRVLRKPSGGSGLQNREMGQGRRPRFRAAGAATIAEMDAQRRSEKLAASPPLFESDFLNFFSRVHPAIPAIVFVPVIGVMEWLGADRGLGAVELLLLTLAGVLIWTLTEYWLHRLVFHWEPDNAFGRRMHFIIHGIHHDHPNDKLRLVMPPAVAIPLAILFFLAFTAIFGTPHAYPIFGGFIAGYLYYDYTHYYVHHFVPRSDLGKRLREQHMRHHFQDHRYGYGVSSPLWDVVFRTLPRKRRAD